VLALYYGGSFNTSTPSRQSIDAATRAIATKPFPSAESIRKISNLLSELRNDDHAPSSPAYICLIATGVMSTAVLLRYWSPTISDQAEAS
jgi:hypothetical protein